MTNSAPLFTRENSVAFHTDQGAHICCPTQGCQSLSGMTENRSKCRFCWKIYEKYWFCQNIYKKYWFCQNISKKHQFWQKITKNCQFSDQKYVLLLHWSCVIHQKLYCCYIGAVSFTKIVLLLHIGVVTFTQNCIVVMLEVRLNVKNCILVALAVRFLHHQKLHCNCNQAKMCVAQVWYWPIHNINTYSQYLHIDNIYLSTIFTYLQYWTIHNIYISAIFTYPHF